MPEIVIVHKQVTVEASNPAVVLPIAGGFFSIGASNNVFNETPTGLVNGSNVMFTTVQTFVAGTTKVKINGLEQVINVHYTELIIPHQIQFFDSPQIGDYIIVDYKT
jgi:hypothetical protein